MNDLATGLLCFACLVLSAGCGTSHGPSLADGGSDAGDIGDCPGPMPTGCTEPSPSSCCLSVPAVCRGGEWICNPSGFRCEGSCSICDPLARYRCHDGTDRSCCGDDVGDAFCEGTTWTCAPGSTIDYMCTSFAPACGTVSSCDALAEAACIASTECAPLYDDACCPTCSDTMGCADCSQIEMHRCAPVEEACSTDPETCGTLPAWACSGGTPDCSSAVPDTGGRCSVPGCVAAVPVDCPECMATCVPVTGESCVAFCAEVAPECPPGSRAEAGGGCWTGNCIPMSVCTPPTP